MIVIVITGPNIIQWKKSGEYFMHLFDYFSALNTTHHIGLVSHNDEDITRIP